MPQQNILICFFTFSSCLPPFLVSIIVVYLLIFNNQNLGLLPTYGKLKSCMLWCGPFYMHVLNALTSMLGDIHCYKSCGLLVLYHKTITIAISSHSMLLCT